MDGVIGRLMQAVGAEAAHHAAGVDNELSAAPESREAGRGATPKELNAATTATTGSYTLPRYLPPAGRFWSVADEEVLQNAPGRKIVRVGDTVRRPVRPWSPAVHALLRYLERVGFPSSPRVLGVDGEGREMLTYLDGESGPLGWRHAAREEGLTALARLLRQYHDTVAAFRPGDDLRWYTGQGGSRPGEVICHGDFGPWNIVWRDGLPAGVIDWDTARPANPLHDVAYALEYVAPFRDDAECLRWLGYSRPPDRRRRLELFAAAYGLTDVAGLADRVIQVQQDGMEQVRRLAAAGHEPQAGWVHEGYLDELARRITWSRANRYLFG